MIFYGTSIIEFLTWTPVGDLNIKGTNTRYWIPFYGLLPFIFNINTNNFDNSKLRDYTMLFLICFVCSMILAMGFPYY